MSIDNLYPGLVTPLPVAVGYHPFVDYRFIHPGRARWVDDEGRFHDAWGLNNPESLHADFPAVPRGVELRAEAGGADRTGAEGHGALGEAGVVAQGHA